MYNFITHKILIENRLALTDKKLKIEHTKQREVAKNSVTTIGSEIYP